MNTRKTDEVGYAGLGAVDPSLEREARKNVEAWEEFRRLAKFKVGDQAMVKGNIVTLTRITPVGGGLVRIQGHYPGGSLDDKLPPSEISHP
jgi:hypothetical protein